MEACPKTPESSNRNPITTGHSWKKLEKYNPVLQIIKELRQSWIRI